MALPFDFDEFRWFREAFFNYPHRRNQTVADLFERLGHSEASVYASIVESEYNKTLCHNCKTQ